VPNGRTEWNVPTWLLLKKPPYHWRSKNNSNSLCIILAKYRDLVDCKNIKTKLLELLLVPFRLAVDVKKNFLDFVNTFLIFLVVSTSDLFYSIHVRAGLGWRVTGFSPTREQGYFLLLEPPSPPTQTSDGEQLSLPRRLLAPLVRAGPRSHRRFLAARAPIGCSSTKWRTSPTAPTEPPRKASRTPARPFRSPSVLPIRRVSHICASTAPA
jgi:hypothetical protein